MQSDEDKQTLDCSTQVKVSDFCIDSDMLFSNWETSDFPPSRVKQSKFKQELIAIMALSKVRTVNFSANGAQSSYYDVNVEDEARRLVEEMEITIQQVQEYEFYSKFVDQLKNDSIIQSNIRRLLSPNSFMQMVIYGLGSIEENYVSQYQLALAILLKRDFSHWIGGIEVFDPVMSPADCKAMEALGCSVLTVNEKCRRQVEKPTLFYLPYLVTEFVGNLLEANWCPCRLNQMIILANSFEDITESCRKTTTMSILDGKVYYNCERERLDYIEATEKHIVELKIDVSNSDYHLIFPRFSWHFFNFDSDLDLDLLLPGDLTKDIRLKLKRHNDKLNKRQHTYRHLNNLAMEPFFNTAPSVWDWSEMNRIYRNARRMHCLWRPPHTGWIKLNFSGKVLRSKNSPAGYGGIFRNEHEDQLAMYSGNLNLGETDSVVANAEALRQGLRCLQYMSPVKKLVVEGDELSIIRWVNHGPDPPKRVAETLSEIFKLLGGCRVCSPSCL